MIVFRRFGPPSQTRAASTRSRVGADRRGVTGAWTLVFAAAGLLAACAADDQGGECATDADCRADQLCLFDEPRGTTYCTTECERDAVCPDTRFCRGVQEDPRSTGREDRALCIERVRVCRDEEPCNGLDDDCDGQVDEGCTPLPCRDETQCGAFSCSAPFGADETICAARPDGAPRTFYRPCSADEECPNGVCAAGLCTPFCRVNRTVQPLTEIPDCRNELLVDIDGDGVDEQVGTICAEQVGPGDRPPHNACQIPCDGPAACPDGLQCVWRRLFPFEDLHQPVCSKVDPARLPLGADCTANSVEGDATCQSGLCFNFKCTRLCEGPSDACDDVSDDFACQEELLVYRDPLVGGSGFTRNFNICSSGN